MACPRLQNDVLGRTSPTWRIVGKYASSHCSEIPECGVTTGLTARGLALAAERGGRSWHRLLVFSISGRTTVELLFGAKFWLDQLEKLIVQVA